MSNNYKTSYRMYRGGSWRYPAWFLRIPFRSRGRPSSSLNYLGFRLVEEVKNDQN